MTDQGRCPRILDKSTGLQCARWEGHDGICWTLSALWQFAKEVLASESKTGER